MFTCVIDIIILTLEKEMKAIMQEYVGGGMKDESRPFV
jgi:hypothetical protein